MNFEEMSKEELVDYIKNINESNNGKYGLIWDKEKEPEKIVEECNKYIPILKEDESRNIEKENENNILIEGDNFHSLSVLNYTHKEEIDVIYIDPPYNTGNEDFIYNDRFIDEEDGYRHSKWLNFMSKRLRIARDLLKKDGMIFISIDDNELFQLKLLCDKIFGEKNYINTISVNSKVSAGASGGGEDKKLKKNIEYILFYCKNINEVQLEPIYKETELMTYIKKMKEDGKSFKYTSVLYKINDIELYKTIKDGSGDDIILSKVNDYEIKSVKQVAEIERMTEEEVYNKFYDKIMTTTNAQTSIRTRVWEATGSKNDMYIATYKPKSGKNKGKETNLIFMGKQKVLVIWLKDTCVFHNKKAYKKEKIGTFWDGFSWINVTKEGNMKFDNGKKPIKMIQQLISLHPNNEAVILDFFAGSGSTGHAVLEKNKEDNGKRKFILCTNNEISKSLQIEYMKNNDLTEKDFNQLKEKPDEKLIKYYEKNGICTSVTYPRMKNVIDGYKDKKGLNSTLRYYKTDFVENEGTRDQIYYDLTEKCIPMLCVKEDTYEVIEKNDQYAIYTNKEKNKFTCVYFDTIGNKYEEFIDKVKAIEEKKILYIFTLGNKIEEPRLAEIKNYTIEAIPQRIYELYKKLAKMSKEN